jgi:hypothetical protein
MTRCRPIALAGVAAAVALAPAAAAQAPQPTLQFDRPCYTEDQQMVFSGTGYTPGGPVELSFQRLGAVLGTFDTTADAAGAIGDYVMATDADMLGDDEDRATRFVAANDRTRIDAGAPPETQFAATQFTFTRWAGFSPGRYVPGQKVRVEAYGWAFAAGKPLYFLFQKGHTTVASVKAGRLSETCGDRVARVRVPKKLKAGAYRLVLSTQKRSASGLSTWRKGRVVKRAAASAATVHGAMARG